MSGSHAHSHHHHHAEGERKTYIVLALTIITMIAEIVAGTVFGSMALLADGWHMGTHAAAFSITLFAYYYARKHQNNPQFSLGVGKVNVLGGYSSAIALGMVALMMIIESVGRFFEPTEIRHVEAMVVAAIGLTVNLVSAVLLHHDHDHDHNLKAAYMHVIADALTSLLAIVALVFALLLGWNWLDPVMGIVGGLVIIKWAYNLMRNTAPILLDKAPKVNPAQAVQSLINANGNTLVEARYWEIGEGKVAANLTVQLAAGQTVSSLKNQLVELDTIGHISIQPHA